MAQEFGYVVYDANSISGDINCQRIDLPPITLKIEKTMIKCGSMIYFPPLDEDAESHTLTTEGPIYAVRIQWGDVVPGSVIQLSNIRPPKELIEIRIRWSLFMPGVVLYFAGFSEIPIRIRNHPMVLVVPWIQSKFLNDRN